MRKLIASACALSACAALPAATHAGRDTDRATGGGQVLVGNRGAGDTIAFTAQGTRDAARGQVQYQDRTGGTGQGHVSHHGAVVCLHVAGKTARIAGMWREGHPFQIYVVDAGNGGNDTVTFVPTNSAPSCNFEPPDADDQLALSRGNTQVYDADGGQQRRPRAARVLSW